MKELYMFYFIYPRRRMIRCYGPGDACKMADKIERNHTEANKNITVLACCLVGANPLNERMLDCCKWNHWKQFSLKWESQDHHFHLEILKRIICKIVVIFRSFIILSGLLLWLIYDNINSAYMDECWFVAQRVTR